LQINDSRPRHRKTRWQNTLLDMDCSWCAERRHFGPSDRWQPRWKMAGSDYRPAIAILGRWTTVSTSGLRRLRALSWSNAIAKADLQKVSDTMCRSANL